VACACFIVASKCLSDIVPPYRYTLTDCGICHCSI
jgi:hypothetical protein